MQHDQRIEAHYSSHGIADRILAAFRAVAGEDAALDPEALAPLDHFHSGGLAATRAMAELLAPQPADRVLDIGSGIGGPARWIAWTYGCHVTGVDLTSAFCRAAAALTQATGLVEKVRILHGDALSLPLPDAAFERAYSQNVAMNIADKPAFYAEAMRVLRPGGHLALSNLAAGPAGTPHYPTPWAATAATSFLSTPAATREDLEAVGFEIVAFRETAEELRPLQAAVVERLQTKGLPRLGMHVLMGERMLQLQLNSARSLLEGRLTPIEVLVRKPG